MASQVRVVPFPPGHFEAFNLKLSGKVESIQMDQFHSCVDEPAHSIYDSVGKLPSGKPYVPCSRPL